MSEIHLGYRVTSDQLSDADAIAAMQKAVNWVAHAALSARRDLLDAGFADSHTICMQLDQTAQHYTDSFQVLRRQQRRLQEQQ